MSMSPGERIRRQTAELRRLISTMDAMAAGTLHIRTKVCGRSSCRCAQDPQSRHGPYYEWSRSRSGRLRHHILTPYQAQLVEHAIANHRELQRLLLVWDDATAAEILNNRIDCDEPRDG
jgi:hypothetical protein